MTALSQEVAFARIRLLRSPNVGPVSFRQLLRRFCTAQAALEALPDLAGGGGAKYQLANQDRVTREIAAVRATCSMTARTIPRCWANSTVRRQS